MDPAKLEAQRAMVQQAIDALQEVLDNDILTPGETDTDARHMMSVLSYHADSLSRAVQIQNERGSLSNFK